MSDPHVDTHRGVLERLDTVEPGEAADLVTADGQDLVALHYPAPATGCPGCGALGAATLYEQSPDTLTGPPATLEPQTKAQLLPGSPDHGDVLLGVGLVRVRLVQTLDSSVTSGQRETLLI